MKKNIFILLFLGITTSLSAQSISEEYQKDAQKLIDKVSPLAYEAMLKPIKEFIPQEKYADFETEIKTVFPSFMKELASVYTQTFTHAEIKEILKFYDTPVGKKMASEMGNLMKKAEKWVKNGQKKNFCQS